MPPALHSVRCSIASRSGKASISAKITCADFLGGVGGSGGSDESLRDWSMVRLDSGALGHSRHQPRRLVSSRVRRDHQPGTHGTRGSDSHHGGVSRGFHHVFDVCLGRAYLGSGGPDRGSRSLCGGVGSRRFGRSGDGIVAGSHDSIVAFPMVVLLRRNASTCHMSIGRVAPP